MLVWDATCPDTYAPSHISDASRETGAVAAQAERLKNAKCVCVSVRSFLPLRASISRNVEPSLCALCH